MGEGVLPEGRDSLHGAAEMLPYKYTTFYPNNADYTQFFIQTTSNESN